ncbi:MAG: FCD domain-containing protein [Gammaproteobacteria bacterium]|nr:FCD domain-containing protein [Gammaproteobacteria bacterium]
MLAKSDHKEIFVQTLVDNVRQAAKALGVNLEECHQLDTAFHRALIEASENPFLIQSYHGISNRLHALRQLLPFTKARLNAALKQHRQLIAAIKQNNIEDAQSIIEEHIANVEAMLLQRLDKPRDSHTVIRSRGSRRG